MHATRSIPLLLMAACVAPLGDGTVTQDIVGGTQVQPTQYPTVVGLLEGGNNWFCTGVLVDKDWVMTSASCFEGINNQVQARLDDATISNDGGRTVQVSEIHKHPQFNINSATWSHDIAMLKLAESVLDRMPSPLHRQLVDVAASITQVGYGVNNNNGGGGGVLRSLATSSVDCAQADESGISNANLICFNASDGTGSCYGDGGAPAFFNGAVAGLGSGGTSNSCTSGLDVYTAIAPEQSFIDTYLPAVTPPPPPMDQPDPPTDTPEDTTDPDADDEDNDDHPLQPVRGCNTGGGTGGLLAIGLALLVINRRRGRGGWRRR